MEIKKKMPNSITIKMSGQNWGEINRLCNLLKIDPYIYVNTSKRRAGPLIFALTKSVISGTGTFPIPNPEDYI